jgi:hypothetical protein
MADVLLVRPADSPGYTRFVLADPVGHPQAGVVVTAETDGGPFEIILHGQDRSTFPEWWSRSRSRTVRSGRLAASGASPRADLQVAAWPQVRAAVRGGRGSASPFPPRLWRGRAARCLPRRPRGRFLVVPPAQDAVESWSRPRLKAAPPRRRQVARRGPGSHSHPPVLPVARRARVAKVRKGCRFDPPWDQQVGPVAPAYPPQNVRARVKPALLKRGRRVEPPWPQAVIVAPPYPPQSVRARVKPELLRRARRFDPRWVVTVTGAPTVLLPTSVVTDAQVTGLVADAQASNVVVGSAAANLAADANVSGLTGAANVTDVTAGANTTGVTVNDNRTDVTANY